MDLIVGDRVVATLKMTKYYDNIKPGFAGRVVRYDHGQDFVYVEWDNYVCGHDCDGLAEYGYGWNVPTDAVELECSGDDFEIPEVNAARILFEV